MSNFKFYTKTIYVCIALLYATALPQYILAQSDEDFANLDNSNLDGPDARDEYNNQIERDRQAAWDSAGVQLNDVANEQAGTNLPYAKIYPEQSEKTPATTVASSAGTCFVQQLAGQLAKKLSSMLARKVEEKLNPFNLTLVPVYMPSYDAKEVGTVAKPSEDGIGYCIANSIIEYISQSTIDWINSGFKGNPVFVDDPSRIFKDLKEDTLNSFVDSFGNGILCKQFDIRVKLALVTRERTPKRYNCTYDQAVRNLQNEPFSLKVFDEVTQVPMNNPIGAFLTLDSEYLAIKNEREKTLTRELNWGEGYLPWKNKDGSGTTVTPGKVVQGVVEKRLNLASDRLVLADEFDEVLTALVNQLIKTAVQETLGDQ